MIDELKKLKVDVVITGRVSMMKEFVGKKQVSEFVEKNVERTYYWVEIDLANLSTDESEGKLQDKADDQTKFQASALGISKTIEKLYPPQVIAQPEVQKDDVGKKSADKNVAQMSFTKDKKMV